MKKKVLGLIAASVLVVAMAACPGGKKAEGQGVASQWLKSVDAGDYAQAWEATAPIMKASISKDQWVAIVQGDRAPLGPLVARKLTSSEYTQASPGAPPGHYVVLQYESDFANRNGVTESVTLTQDNDGEWRVSLYVTK